MVTRYTVVQDGQVYEPGDDVIQTENILAGYRVLSIWLVVEQ